MDRENHNGFMYDGENTNSHSELVLKNTGRGK